MKQENMGTPSNVSPSAFKFDISSFLPEGHEKAFKQAFYNVAASVFVLFIFAAFVAVYYVLEPFLRPLLWAVLFGSVLHPLKQTMTVVLKSWLQTLEVNGTPLTVGVLTSPFLVFDNASEQMWDFTLQYAVMFICIIGCILIAFLLYSCVPDFITVLVCKVLNHLLNGVASLLEFCHGATLFVWSVVIGHIIILCFWWTPRTRPYLIFMSPIVWTVLICHLISVAGTLRVTLLLICFGLMFIGFFS